jgi:protoheme IX farnesyltransferase
VSMSTAVAPRAHVRDFAQLLKPGITAMSVFMAVGVLALAPWPGWGRAAAAAAGIAMLVGAANALNMYVERESDRLMERTRTRPLPAGRMAPHVALAFGIVLAIAAFGVLALVNPLTFALGALALVLYIGVYTPMKRRTPAALVVGAIPGAMPALMGWTAATGRIEPVGFVLFLVLFAWQVPHFLAISLFRREEYARAGIRIVPEVRGEKAARRELLASTCALLPLSLALVPLHAGRIAFVVLAVAGGAWLLVLAVRCQREGAGHAEARSYFRATLAYLPMLVVGLVVDGALR